MIFNIGGGGEDSLKLPVLDSAYPANVTVSFGKGEAATASFSVVIKEAGYPASYGYKWYLDGEAISGSNSAVLT